MGDVCEIPLDQIGLDPRPQRQIRPLDYEHVRALMETTVPHEWDAIEVRLWPATDPYPSGEEDRLYQVISGYHRTTAARNLGLEMIRAVIVSEPLDEATFALRAFHTNARHGKPMSTDEKQSLARRLRTLGMSENDIAHEMGTPKGTIHNWLSGRNTNASRSKGEAVRTHRASDDTGDDDALGLPDAWRADMAAALDSRRLAQVSSTIYDFIASTPAELAPGDVMAWVAAQSPQTRRSLVSDIESTVRWLGYLHTALVGGMPKAATASATATATEGAA